MLKKITETTGTYGLGLPIGRKLLRVASGPYRGRLAALMQTATGEIKLAYADRPYISWSSLITVATDSADQPFDCAIDSAGNIHVVYTEVTSDFLLTRKLSFSGGVWSVGAKVTIFNGDLCYHPTLALESDTILWVSWTRKVSSIHYVNVKSSTDGGAVWGSGPADIGDTLTAGASSAYSKCLIDSVDVHVVYTEADWEILRQSRLLSGGAWSSAFSIAVDSVSGSDFDASISNDGLFGVVFNRNKLEYREYDGNSWSSVLLLDSNAGGSPQIKFTNNVPTITYLYSLASDQKLLQYVSRATGTFSAPAVIDGRMKQFEAVFLYDSVSQGYADLTTAAASNTTADIFHPSSGALVKSVGDIVYFGMSQRFRYLKFLLSTAGAGGTVILSYFDGVNWKAFTPSSGAFDLDLTDHDLALFEDFNSMPSDWQQSTVNASVQYWVKIEVTTAFSTLPVGSQMTAVSDLSAVIVRR